jgi:bifunctional DNase/RNase
MDNFSIGIDRILIDDLDEQVFYARLMLRNGGREIEVDARPSDCIALAVRSEAKIFIEQGILDKVSIDRKEIEAAGNIEDFFE